MELKVGDRFYSVGGFYMVLKEISKTEYKFICDNGEKWDLIKRDLEGYISVGAIRRVKKA